MRVLDLFSGIGGFSLGLELAGMRTVQFVECDPFCRAVLAKHWPDVPCHEDVRTFRASAGFADLICGGFPCQDISVAGRGAGLAGERSGLWVEFARIIGDVRPRFAIVENVSALCSRGLGTVLSDLAALGYDAEWHCIPASAVGAPHRRDRIWIIAYAISDQLRHIEQWDAGRRLHVPSRGEAEPRDDGAQESLADTVCGGREGPGERRSLRPGEQCGPSTNVAHTDSAEWRTELACGHNPDGNHSAREKGSGRSGNRGQDVADTNGQRQLQPRGPVIEIWRWLGDGSGMGDTNGQGLQAPGSEPPGEDRQQGRRASPAAGWWTTEPDVGRMAHGVPARMDRLRSLGNAVVPQIPEIIGRAIMRAAA